MYHSAQGQGPSLRYTDRRADAGLSPSGGSRGDACDNAWRRLDGVEVATLTWSDGFNTRRWLEPISDVPPTEYEAQTYEQAAVA